MPKKEDADLLDKNIKQKMKYIGLDNEEIQSFFKEYTKINFRTIKGYDEKKYKQYRFVNVEDIEILLSPTNRLDSVKEKYEKAMPLCYYLDNKNEQNLINYTKFLEMLKKVKISQIEAVEKEQEMLSKALPFKVKYMGNYLWQIYYSEISNKYFMLVPIEDSDYSTFFYLLKKKIENKKRCKVFVPISLVDYEEKILSKQQIRDLENYLWFFTKDYPSIYEVYNKKEEANITIFGETEIYEKIRTLYRIKIANLRDAVKFYKLVKALFILQTELPHYYKFNTNIDNDGIINFYYDDVKIEYEILPEFIKEQYLKSIGLKNNVELDYENFRIKLKKLKQETERLEQEYMSKEKQITTFLECKKTFFGKVKYFFKFGKKTNNEVNEIKHRQEYYDEDELIITKNEEKFKMEERNYTLYELEQSYKELEVKEDALKKAIMDINALKLKNKNLKKKIENASNYIEEINKHKKSIFEFWKYSNKDAVATLDEGEEEELNVSKIEKIFNYEDNFEEFGIKVDKIQRNKYTDSELDSAFIATTELINIANKINLRIAENKEISEVLKELKSSKEELVCDSDEDYDVFGKFNKINNKEVTIGSKTHREQRRNVYDILEIKKGCKGIELKKSLERIVNDWKTAIEKNSLDEDMYVYKAISEKIEFNKFEVFSLSAEDELEEFLKQDKIRRKIYLYRVKLKKGTNFVGFSNIIFYDNQNMTLPVGMNLSSKILIDLSRLNLKNNSVKELKKAQFEDEKNDFSKVLVKTLEISEYEEMKG